MAAPTDPFTLVYRGLKQLVLNSVPLQSMVKSGNLVWFDNPTQRDPTKETVSDADMPELVLAPYNGSMNLHATSSDAEVHMQYHFLLNTGDFRVHYRVFPVQWALVSALADWQSVLGPLVWEGYHFLKKLDVNQTVTGATATADPSRHLIKGWTTVLMVDALMRFPTKSILSFNSMGD